MDDAEKAVGELVSAEWVGTSGDELLDVLGRVEACVRQLQAVSLAVVRQIDDQKLAAEVGASSTAALLRQVLRLSPGEARRRVETAKVVVGGRSPSGAVTEPVLAEAAGLLRAGEISDEHLQVMRTALRNLPDGVDLGTKTEVKHALAEYALTFDPLLLGKIAKRIQLNLDPDGSLRSEEAAVEARELTISRQGDGMYRVRGRLDAEAAGTVMKALSPLAAPKAAVDGVKDLRSGARRNADALVELAQRALKAKVLPRSGGQRPQLIVSVSYETLIGKLDRAGVPVLDNGEPITAEAARRIACDGEIVPVVLGGKSQPLDVGRKKRVVPPHIRRALIARDGGCSFPACDRPPDWCEAHHIVHWLHSGDTEVENMTLQCGHHHGVVHAQGWEIVMINGHPHFIPPRWLDADRTPRRNHMHRPLG